MLLGVGADTVREVTTENSKQLCDMAKIGKHEKGLVAQLIQLEFDHVACPKLFEHRICSALDSPCVRRSRQNGHLWER